MTRSVEDVYDALTDCGIFLGDQGKRDQLAQQLVKGGASGGAIHLIERHCRRTYGDDFSKKTGAMRKILDGPWQSQVADLRQFEKREAERTAAAPKEKKGKVEPGLNERVSNQATRELLAANWYGMGLRELQHFKYRWICAEWHHKGFTDKEVCAPQPQGMGCSIDELRSWVIEFPKGRTLDDALAIHSGKSKAEEVEAREAEDAKKLAEVKAVTREKNKARRDRKPDHDTSRPWSRNEYSETADRKKEVRRQMEES